MMRRTILAAFILTLAWADIAESQLPPQLPAPGLVLYPGLVLIADGCTRCVDGDRVAVTLHAFRPGVAQSVVEVRAVVRAPDGSISELPISGTTITLPAGPSSLVILDAPVVGAAAGVYLVEGAFLDPRTGATLARHVLAVVRE